MVIALVPWFDEEVGVAPTADFVDPVALDTRLAIERMSPVRTSITSAIPLVAWVATICAARSCSVVYCSCWSKVSSRPVPARATRWSVAGVPGRVTPPGDSSSVSLPGVPDSSLLNSYSSPDAPVPDW